MNVIARRAPSKNITGYTPLCRGGRVHRHCEPRVFRGEAIQKAFPAGSPRPNAPSPRDVGFNAQGMSLLELIIVLVMVSIVTVIAIASYRQHVTRGRRADGTSTLLSMAMAQERYRSTHTQYGTLAQAWGGVSTSSEGYYTLSISGVGASTYTLTATAVGTQANDAAGGTSCATLTLSMSSGTITKSPSACWAS